MHAGTGEVADNGAARFGQAQNKDDAARLIFAQKAPCRTADDQSRQLVAVSLHVDAGAVTGDSLNIDLAALHGVSGGVADAAVDDDPPIIHRIANGVLRISADLDVGTVQIGTQRIPWCSRNFQMSLFRPRANESLPETSGDQKLSRMVLDMLIQLAVIQLRCINMEHDTTPSVDFLS